MSRTDSDVVVNPDATTIVAIATGAAKGGIGIVRLSGDQAKSIAEKICGKSLTPRLATYRAFSDGTDKNDNIDEGIALYFPRPHSFTGEDVVELQAHGGPVILSMLVEACVGLGARIAKPGEFSERAFLNDRIDLSQAEAIADLIDASSTAAVKAASRSLGGVFSKRIAQLQLQLTDIRVFVESALDFPEEEIDFLQDRELQDRMHMFSQLITETMHEAKRGALVNEGAKIAIIGRPNAGKSSLMNCLARRDVAIVTDVAGTTRDSIEQQIELQGVPVTLVDTAGLNDLPDQVEQIGIERSKQQAQDADLLLVLFDNVEFTDSNEQTNTDLSTSLLGDFDHMVDQHASVIYVGNKIDIRPLSKQLKNAHVIGISALSGAGIDDLIDMIESTLNIDAVEPNFSARSRHVLSLKDAINTFNDATQKFNQHKSGELFAEDLRVIQTTLSEITGSISADDLLGEIFSNFCIGK